MNKFCTIFIQKTFDDDGFDTKDKEKTHIQLRKFRERQMKEANILRFVIFGVCVCCFL